MDAAAPDCRLRLLGVAAWSRPPAAWNRLSRKDAALLARLALDGRQARTAMALWLWPEAALTRAHANLRQRLYRLRQAAGALVDEAEDGLQLAARVAVDLDGEDADFDALLLAGLPHADDAVQDWIDDARRQWLARRADRMTGLAARHEARGALAPALALTEDLLALEPLLEHAWRRLMRLHFLRGDRAAAVAAFERCERVLRDELGLRPSPETVALLARVEALTEAAPTPAPLPPVLLRPPRRVGRTRELKAMAAAWQAGQAFVLCGEAGLGKSRLLAEFAAGRAGTPTVAALPGDEHMPYALLLRLLRALASDAAGAALWPEGPQRRELARLLPELGPTPAAPGLDALLQDAVLAVFERAAAHGREGVLVDDLQHADAASRAVLQAAAATGRLRWGLATRPDARLDAAGWLDSSAHVHWLALAPLDEASVGALIDSLALDPVPDPLLRTRLIDHCGGNPLFLLETLKQLLLEPESARQPQLPLPATVESAVERRLGTLSVAALALLRAAAVAGGDFRPGVAADVLGTTLLALAEAWREVESAQLLRADGFVHEALRDAVLAGLPSALRAPLHERVAYSLQRQGAAAAAVARHFEAARLPDAAARAARQAADDALRLGRFAERLRLLADAARLAAAAGDAAACFEARCAAVAARLACDGPDAALAEAEALVPLAGSAAQRVALALVRAEVALGAYRAGLARDAATAALAEAQPGSRDELRALLLQAAGRSLLGDGVAALRSLAPLRARLEAVEEPPAAALMWSHWALVEHGAGQAFACADALERQRTAARASGHAVLEAEALASLSGLQIATGDTEAAVDSAGEAATLHRRLGDLQGARVADINLAIGLIGLERLAEALSVLDGIAPRGAVSAGADLVRIVDELRAEVWLRAGDAARALTCLGAAPSPEAPLARQLQHALLQALAAQIGGDGARAAARWRALHTWAPRAPAKGVALRARALACVVLEPAAARAELDALVRAGEAAGVPAAAGLARLRRAACAWRDGDLAAALDDVGWLLARRGRLQHLYLPGAEWRALTVRVLDAAGRRAAARALRSEARAWIQAVVVPGLPPGAEAGWAAHPAWRGSFGPD